MFVFYLLISHYYIFLLKKKYSMDNKTKLINKRVSYYTAYYNINYDKPWNVLFKYKNNSNIYGIRFFTLTELLTIHSRLISIHCRYSEN